MGKNRISVDSKLQAVQYLLSSKGSHAEIYTRYGISQTYLYRLRDKALEARQVAMSEGRKRYLSREQQLAESFTATAAGPVF